MSADEKQQYEMTLSLQQNIKSHIYDVIQSCRHRITSASASKTSPFLNSTKQR